MSQGILTEREWRRRHLRGVRPGPRCWGAQCVRPRRPPLSSRRSVHGLMLAVSLSCAFMMPFVFSPKRSESPYRLLDAAGEQLQSVRPARSVSTVSYALPQDWTYARQTYAREELLRGKLMLLDDGHPLPAGVPAPNTMSIVRYGKGMVPVNDLTVKSGKETIAALARLFAALRGKGVDCFTVCRGAMTPWEQGEWRLATLRSLAARLPLDSAREQTLGMTDAPGAGEMQQEYAVDLCLSSRTSARTDRPLGETEQGIALLQTAWRCGFLPVILGEAGGEYCRLRYVGEAHATAMTFLDLELPAYLELLHEKGSLRVKRSDQVEYVILCQPMDGGYVEFAYPQGASREASLDNTGYAVLACTLEGAGA